MPGFLAGVGGLAGVGSVLSGIGSIFGKKDAPIIPNYFKVAKAQTSGSLRGTVGTARRMGIHPLAAMGHSVAGGGAIYDSGNDDGARLRGAGEAFSRYAEGKLAEKVANSELERNQAEIDEIKARTETLKAQTAIALQGGPGGPVNYGDPEATTTENVREVNLVNRHLNKKGSKMDVDVGPDIGEVIMGGVISAATEMKEKVEDSKMREMYLDYYASRMTKPIEWDPRFGDKRPKGWGRMSNKQKLKWIMERR